MTAQPGPARCAACRLTRSLAATGQKWKVATAAKALEAHRPKGDSGNGTDPELTALYALYDEAEKTMRALPTLEARRQAARDMAPFIAELDESSRRIAIANGQDSELVHLRADAMYRLILRGIEGPCEWTHDEALEAIAVFPFTAEHYRTDSRPNHC